MGDVATPCPCWIWAWDRATRRGACRAEGQPVPLSFAKPPPALAARRLQQHLTEVGRRGGQGGRAPPSHFGVWGLSVPAAGPLAGSWRDFSLSGRIWLSLGRCFQFWLRVSCLDPASDMMLSLPGVCSGVRSQQSTCLVFNIARLLLDFSPFFPHSVLGLVLGPPPWAARVLLELGNQGAGWKQPFCPGGPAVLALGWFEA